MAQSTIACPKCGARNRVPVTSKGRARCGKCHTDLPWLLDVGEADYDAVLAASPVPLLVDLWAPWCGPCRTIAPVLQQLAADRAGNLRVAKVNVDENPGLSARLGVQGIPTMILYQDGREIGRQVGAMPGDRIATWVDSVTASR